MQTLEYGIRRDPALIGDNAAQTEGADGLLRGLRHEQSTAGRLLSDPETLNTETSELLTQLGIHHRESPLQALHAMEKKWFGDTRKFVQAFRAAPTAERLEAYKNLGFVDTVRSPVPHADVALVMGGTEEWVQDRFQALIEEWKRGVRFDSIVMLGSDRALDPKTEPVAEKILNNSWTGIPVASALTKENAPPEATEFGMMRYLWQPPHSVQREMDAAGVEVKWIESTEPGEGRNRVNTADTVRDYIRSLDGQDSPSSVIVVSSQPFVGYQEATSKLEFLKQGREAPETFGVGLARDPLKEPVREYGYLNILRLRLREEYILEQRLTV